MKYVTYSWQDFDRDIAEIMTYTNLIEYDMLVGVSCGGLPLLVTLVNRTGLPYGIVKAKSYIEEKKLKRIYLEFPIWGLRKPTKILVLEDISDSGRTLSKIVKHFKKENIKVETLALFYRKNSKFRPDYYLNIVNKEWVVMPWEK